jgi:hypothetical protein
VEGTTGIQFGYAQLIAWYRVFLDKLIRIQLLKKFLLLQN